MKRFPLPSFFLLCGAALLLQGCGGSDTYSRGSTWDYKKPAAQPAQNAPAGLGAPNAAAMPIDALNMPDSAENAAIPQGDLSPVKVAILLPLSGKHAALGEAMLNAAQLALFEVGYNSFELMPRDTQATASGGAAAARDAINNGAQLILGPVFSDAVNGAKPVAHSAGVNIVAFTTDWTLADRSTFIMGFLPFDQVGRISNYAAGQGIRDVGVFSPASDYGDSVVGAFNGVARQAGLNTAVTRRFAANGSGMDNDMRIFSNFEQRQQAGAPAPMEAMFMPAGSDTARQIGRLASQYGMPPAQVRRLGTGLMDDAKLATEPSLQGAWFAAPSPSLRKGFERRYAETYALSPPRLATLAYDATALAAILARNGLQQSGAPSFDAASIGNANGFAGIDGIFRFREDGMVERGLAVLEYSNGTMRVIDEAPRSFQQQGM